MLWDPFDRLDCDSAKLESAEFEDRWPGWCWPELRGTGSCLLPIRRSGEKDPLKWQIDTGEGFLKDAPDDMMGDMLGAGMAMAKATASVSQLLQEAVQISAIVPRD